MLNSPVIIHSTGECGGGGGWYRGYGEPSGVQGVLSGVRVEGTVGWRGDSGALSRLYCTPRDVSLHTICAGELSWDREFILELLFQLVVVGNSNRNSHSDLERINLHIVDQCTIISLHNLVHNNVQCLSEGNVTLQPLCCVWW